MRLKSLEIKGFKSFANETVLHFEEDVIGVVGPNGSGKSNIVDAIRWVLGEQKGKELRLENMGDVIFNGTKKRKAGAMAQVTLTFDNTKNFLPTEYTTVAISRVLYRSGESEYKLNGVTCRLKDIRSLFMDTGIGSNSYAIIALGMVDDILADKENARRKMFEQAAGISKYKKRKHETLLKLKNTTADLNRIEDLLFEIQNNLKSLEKQAKRTQKYVDLKSKYKDASIQLAVRKTGHIKEEYAQLEKQIETEKDVFRQLEADLNKKSAQLEELKRTNLDDEKSVGGVQRELNLLVGTIRTMENEKNLLEQKVVFIDQTKKRLESQVTANVQKLSILDEEVGRIDERIGKTRVRTNELSEQLELAKASKSDIQNTYQEKKSNRQSLSESQQRLEKEIYQLEREVAITQANLNNLVNTRAQNDAETKVLYADLKAMEKEIKGVRKERDDLEKRLVTLEKAEQKRFESIQSAETKLTDIQEKLSKTHRKLDAKNHEHDLLKDMVARLEGFPESIKYLSKSKDWEVEAPLLSDIIYCAPDYRKVVEYFLEPYLNHMVVDSVDGAAKAIQLLHSKQKGKANFFILEELAKGNAGKNGNQKTINGAKSLVELIEVDDKFKPLVQNLMGHVWISEDSPLDSKYDHIDFGTTTLIDQSGKIIRTNFTLSGGSVGLFEGKKLGRKKNLEMLAKEIKQLEKDQEKAQGQKEQQQQLILDLKGAHQKDMLKDLRQQLAEGDQAYIQQKSLIQHKQSRLSELEEKDAKAKALREKMELELKEKMANFDRKTKEATTSTTLFDEVDAEFNKMVESLSNASQHFNEVQLTYLQQKNHLETQERELNYKVQQKDEINSQQESHKIQLTNDMVELGQIEVSLQNLDQELHNHYAQKKDKETDLSSIEQQYYQARNSISELENKVRKITKEQQNSQYLINQLKEQYSDLKFTISSVSERLHIEFAVRLEDVIGAVEVSDAMDIDEMQAKVDRMKHRIEHFGEINPMAIEAYEEMSERYQTIDTQRNDIIEAKESLLQTIEEIEKTATEKFLSAFEEVRINFIDVFRSLFTEDDNCDLILENPEKPLDSKIRIIAKPKGKRPKSLSQLSGGEKTLTATALLFSLYLLKPAPFCIFDEVDAPLDDANIQKFNKIIKKFSKDSQFIIVTHNKSTMAAVDIIYGVYMEEMGVSALSQVDFRSFEHQEFLSTLN